MDKKREATSPPIPDVTVMEKKTRHVTGDGASAVVPDDEIHDVEDVVPMTLDDSDGNPGGSGRIHMLSHPLDVNEAKKQLDRLRALQRLRTRPGPFPRPPRPVAADQAIAW